MKNIFIIIVSLLSITACSQPATVKYVNNSIDSFSKTLDSSIVKKLTTTNNNPTIIDTLKIDGNPDGVFLLIIKSSISGAVASGQKIVTVRKNGTTVVLVRDFNVMPYWGDANLNNASWSTVAQNGMVFIKVTGIAGKSILWTISKQLLL